MLTTWINTLALLWAGMILGISFFESWIKFKTPGLTKVTGLQVGRTVFSNFHRLQIFLFVLLSLLTAINGIKGMQVLFLVIIALTLLLQIIWLFPILSKRVDALIKGDTLTSSHALITYGVNELNKLFVLILFALY